MDKNKKIHSPNSISVLIICSVPGQKQLLCLPQMVRKRFLSDQIQRPRQAGHCALSWLAATHRFNVISALFWQDFNQKKKRPWPRDPVVPACERSVDVRSGEKAINLVFPVERRRRSEPADVGRGGRFSHSWGAAGGTRHASTPPRRGSSGAVNRVKVKAFSDRSRWPGDEEGKLSDCSVKQGNKTSRRDWTADSGVLTTGC